MKRIIVLVAAFLFSSMGYAAQSKYYAGISLGKSTFDSGVSNLTGTASLTEDASPYKIFGGYIIDNEWSLELGVIPSLTLAEVSANTGDTFSLSGATLSALVDGVKLKFDGSATVFSAKYTAAIGNDFDLFGKIGMASYTLDAKVSSPLGSGTLDSTSGSAFTYGLGASYNITKKVAARAEYEYFNFESGDYPMTMMSVGISYAF